MKTTCYNTIDFTITVPCGIFIQKRLSIVIPIDLNFKDEAEKARIFDSWRHERNVPPNYPELRKQLSIMFEELKISPSYFEMGLRHNPNGAFIFFNTSAFNDTADTLKKVLKTPFPNYRINGTVKMQKVSTL